MDYELTLRSAKYPADVDAGNGDVLPGRPLAEDIAAELRKVGYTHVKVVDLSPLWDIQVSARPKGPAITVFVTVPSKVPREALWTASIASKRGLWARLTGQPEDAETLKLARALESAVRAIGGIEIVEREGNWDK